ncbi:hypothetical protein LTR85_006336 [Meristemomyces frigidus]|nr:hypothetical protein LTR85_006336 [Meristemomyces frigidus]
MAPLPDDVMLVVISRMDIDTFLSCRLLNHKVHDLIDTHINGLTDAVAHATFPTPTRVLDKASDSQNRSVVASLQWLQKLKLQQLAAIMLECPAERSVAAEDPLGDSLRVTITKGWTVLDRFAKIAADVGQLPVESLPVGEVPSSSSTANEQPAIIEIPYLRELETCSRRLQYVETLSLDEIRGYRYLRDNLLREAFGYEQPSPDLLDYGDLVQPGKSLAEPWVFSYLAKLGPQACWNVWWNHRSVPLALNVTLTDDIESAWLTRDSVMRKLERHGIETVDYQISRIMRKMRTTSLGSRRRPTTDEARFLYYGDNLAQLEKQRATLTEEGEPLPERVLGAVPFRQKLDWTSLGPPPRPIIIPALKPHERICPNNIGRREGPNVLPEFRKLYEEWEQGWMERRSWERVG